MQRQQQRPVRARTRRGLAAGAALVSLAGLVTGCGGSSSLGHAPQSASPQRAQQTPPLSNSDVSGAAHPKHASRAPAQTHGLNPGVIGGQPRHNTDSTRASSSTQKNRVNSTAGIQKAVATPARTNDEHSSKPIQGFNPCTLVSVREAQAITGGGVVASSEAPLGPTCLYLGSHSRPQITVAVEAGSYTQISRRLDRRTKMVIRGHRAACGRLGRQMLFMRVVRGRVLNVTAPCSIARQFAAVAARRLAA
jgi:hypothetical protein